MVLVAVIVWLVVVGACFVYALVCGLRTYRRVRAAQATIMAGSPCSRARAWASDERTAELNEKMARCRRRSSGSRHARPGSTC